MEPGDPGTINPKDEETFKYSLVAAVDNKNEVELIENWLGKWESQIRIESEEGCGCCVVGWNVETSLRALLGAPKQFCAPGWLPKESKRAFQIYSDHWNRARSS